MSNIDYTIASADLNGASSIKGGRSTKGRRTESDMLKVRGDDYDDRMTTTTMAGLMAR